MECACFQIVDNFMHNLCQLEKYEKHSFFDLKAFERVTLAAPKAKQSSN